MNSKIIIIDINKTPLRPNEREYYHSLSDIYYI